MLPVRQVLTRMIYYYEQKKKQYGQKKITAVLAIFLLIIFLPTITFAMRRHHRYHAENTKANLTPTPTPDGASAAVTESNLLTGQWSYLPGATKADTGLTIHGTDLAIVSQDGQNSVPNPPINLAGTYLSDISGDFSITATMQVPGRTAATMQLYSNPPIIADEFRIEKPSLRLTVADSGLTVSTWSTRQTPTTQQFSLPLDGTLKLTLTRQGNTIQLSANDTAIGTVQASSLFASGDLWFGFDSDNGDWTLTGLSVQPLNGGVVHIADGSEIKITDHNLQGLQALATKKRPGFLVGMAMALGPMVSDPNYTAVALDSNMFGSLTPENDMKMQNLQPQQGYYTFQKADALIKLAHQNGITDIHGHTLVFAEANPPWFNALPVKTDADKTAIEKIMLDHITTVVKHFGNKVNSWDVVNEPLADYDDFDEDSGRIFRNHKWYQAMGSSYIIKAFKAAYDANPKALLSINEYGLEEDGERWDTFINFLKEFKSDLAKNNIPQNNISIGFEAHIYESGDRINTTVLRNHIEQLATMGFKAQISENDVYSDDGTSIQTKQYADVFNACISEPNCIAYRGWMLSDKYDVFQDDDGSIQYGVDGLFDKSVKPRPALTSMQNLLSGGLDQDTPTPTP